MATGPYDEFRHSGGGGDVAVDPMFHWNTYFPQKLSLLQLAERGIAEAPAVVRAGISGSSVNKSRKLRQRNAARFKTQPITFDEIQEIDEAVEHHTTPSSAAGGGAEGGATARINNAAGAALHATDVDAANQMQVGGDGACAAPEESSAPFSEAATKSAYAALQAEYERRRRRSRKDRRQRKNSIDELPDA